MVWYATKTRLGVSTDAQKPMVSIQALTYIGFSVVYAATANARDCSLSHKRQGVSDHGGLRQQNVPRQLVVI